MTKYDLVKQVSDNTGISRDAVHFVFNDIIDTIKSSLGNGQSIYIRGLFTLSTIKRKKKITRDIRRKKTIISPAHYVPYAKFSNELCENVRKIPVENNN